MSYRQLKKVALVIGVLVFTLNLSVLRAQNSNNLIVIIKNIELIQGTLELQLASDSLQFNGSTEANLNHVRSIKVTAHEMQVVFNNLSNGDYALAIYQDLNENDKLDKKKFGIPAEPFAFSNDALRRFGPPYFEQAKFNIDGGGNHSQVLNMIYRKPSKPKK